MVGRVEFLLRLILSSGFKGKGIKERKQLEGEEGQGLEGRGRQKRKNKTVYGEVAR